MSKLYELSGSVKQLYDQLEEMDLDQQTIIDTIEGSQELMNFEQKAAAVVRMMKNWEADTVAYDSEIKRLTDRKKAIENKVKSIKQYIQDQMEFAGLDKVKCDVFTLAMQNNPPAVVIDDENLIPAEYQIIKYDIDKKKIGYYLKEGKEVPGCRLQFGKSLRIK